MEDAVRPRIVVVLASWCLRRGTCVVVLACLRRRAVRGAAGEDYKQRALLGSRAFVYLARCLRCPSSTKIKRIHHTLVKPVRSESQPF